MDSDKSEQELKVDSKKSLKDLEVKQVKPTRRESRVKCKACNKRLGLASRYECRCGSMFCSLHRYAEMHECTHDYRAEGRRVIAMNNPEVKAPKLPKI